jgi:hypothetical protein
MPYASALDSAAARNAIAGGDMRETARYFRESGNNPLQNITATPGYLTPGTNLINIATGTNTMFLPAATGSQDHVRVVIQTTITSGSCIIKTRTNADFFVGGLTFSTAAFAAGSTIQLGGTDALLTLVAASGGLKGSNITFVDIAPNLWLVSGFLSGTTPAAVDGAWA